MTTVEKAEANIYYAANHKRTIAEQMEWKRACTRVYVGLHDSKCLQNQTRRLYCVECPQYSTRRRSASNIHRSGMLRQSR